MGPFRRVNALVRLENACPVLARGVRGEKSRFHSEGGEGEKERKEERERETSWEDAVYWRFADIKWREKEEEGGFMDTGETVSRNRQIKQKSILSGWRRNWSYWAGCEVSEI